MLRYQPELGPELRTPLARYLSLPAVPVAARLRPPAAADPRRRRHRRAAWPRSHEPGPRRRSTSRRSGAISLSRLLRLLRPARACRSRPRSSARRSRGSAARLGAGEVYNDGLRLLRYGRGRRQPRLREEVGYEPRFDAVGAVRDFAEKTRGRSVASSPARASRALARGAAAVSAAATTTAATATGAAPRAAIAEFLRGAAVGRRVPASTRRPPPGAPPTGCRVGCGRRVERAVAAVAGRVPRGRVGLRRGVRRGRLPVLRVPLRRLVAGRGDGREQRPRARPGDAGRQPRRLAVPVRRVDDDRRRS